MNKKTKTIALIGGSYDPITIGHGQLIHQACRMFDEVHVVVAVNPSKRYLFTADERTDLVRAVVKDMGLDDTPVHVHCLSGRLLVHLATELAATHMVRGLRDSVDFTYEEKQTSFNRKINPAIQTVYLTLPGMEGISSSGVKEVFGLEGWDSIVTPDVHPLVLDALRRKHLTHLKMVA